MKAVVISLLRARQRRERIAQRFGEIDLPFEFMDAIDAQGLSEFDIASYTDRSYRNRWGARPLTPSEHACWRSHVRAIGQASIGPEPMTAIFEDDAVPRPELPVVLNALEDCPERFDLVSLARRNRRRPLAGRRVSLTAGRSLGRVQYTEYGAYGYVITREAASYLVGRMTRMRLPVDMELMHFWVHRLNLYFLDEPVVEHDDDSPSHLTPGRTVVLTDWKKPRLRQTAWRLQMGVRKRIGFRHLVRGTIR